MERGRRTGEVHGGVESLATPYGRGMAPTFSVDAEVSQAWAAVAHGARLSSRILQSVGDPVQGSNSAELNAAYPHEKASDWHRSYLGAALEHLVMWADLVAPLKFHPEQVAIHTFRPAYTLGRASLEAASQAVWMTAGVTARECTRRHLSLIRWDYAEHRKSVFGQEAKGRVEKRDATLLDTASGVFAVAELHPPNHYTVLRAAAPVVGRNPDDLERIWRAASGSARGRVWPSLSLQHVFPWTEYEPGQYRTIRIPDTDGMTEVLEAAEQMMTYGVLRHADFCGADIPALMEHARLWLASVVPFREDADPEVVARLRRRDPAAGSQAPGTTDGLPTPSA